MFYFVSYVYVSIFHSQQFSLCSLKISHPKHTAGSQLDLEQQKSKNENFEELFKIYIEI